MPLPSTISNTSTYPRSKNSVIGAFKYDSAKVQIQEQLLHTVSLAVGSSASAAKRGASFVAARTGALGSVFVPLGKTGSPVDNVIVEIWSNDEATGLPSASLASLSILGSPLPTVFHMLTEFDFTSFAITLTQGTRYHIVISRSGAVSGLANYKWYYATADPTGEDYAETYSTTTGLWAMTPTVWFAYQINEANQTQSTITAFLSEETADKVEAWCSYDQGITWAVRDAGHNPVITTTDALKAYEASLEGASVVHVGLVTGVSAGQSAFFDLTPMAWRNAAPNSFGTINANVSGVAPLFAEVRTSDAGKFHAYNGAVELVSAINYRRIKLQRPVGGTPLDIITGTITPPATAVHYDMRFAVEGTSSDLLLFWTQDTSTAIQFRRYKSDNTFGTIVAIPGTTIDPASAYPLGIGVVYLNAGVPYIAVPYYDTALGGIAVARCIASGVDTSANWSTALACACTPEVTLSNPCVLASDGGKVLRLWIVDSTDRKLLYTNDAGTGVWIAPTNWKPTQTYSVAALSMRVLADRSTLVYLDDSGTPRVKYDQLFF